MLQASQKGQLFKAKVLLRNRLLLTRKAPKGMFQYNLDKGIYRENARTDD